VRACPGLVRGVLTDQAVTQKPGTKARKFFFEKKNQKTFIS
jgi:hypothetical protein